MLTPSIVGTLRLMVRPPVCIGLLKLDLDEILSIIVGLELKDGLTLSHYIQGILILIRVQYPVDIKLSEFIDYKI
jgi:hypothetical protein